MLVEFSVSNFRSFKDKQTLSLVGNKSNDGIITGFNKVPHLLKKISVMGPNASGKSNLIKAMAFARQLIMFSHKNSIEETIDVEPYLLKKEFQDLASEFEFVFILDDTLFQYGFSTSKSEIEEEWLFATPKEGRMQKWFWRGTTDEKEEWYVNPQQLKGRRKEWIQETRENTLFLSILGTQKNIDIPRKIISFIKSCAVIASTHKLPNIFTQTSCHESPEMHKKVLKLIQKADLGIKSIKTETTEITEEYIDSLKIPHYVKKEMKKDTLGSTAIDTKTIHIDEDGQEVIFEMDEHESEGTQLFFSLAYPLLDTLENGDVLIIDEIDRSMHFKEIHFIIQLFANQETNPKNAQLIFTNHDVTVLNMLAKEEVYFTEKNNGCASELSSLSQYENRAEVPFLKRYMEGLYGAIPHIGMGV